MKQFTTQSSSANSTNTTATGSNKSSGASGSLGKYREIVFAVALFLVLDLGVLMLNFYISFQIRDDAISINLAGRQRMLSQRVTKSLLAYESNLRTQQPTDAELTELRTATLLFDSTLRSFDSGGEATGGDGQPVKLPRIDGLGRTELQQGAIIWQRYQELLTPVLAGNAGLEEVNRAAAFGRANNVELLNRMNNLTTALETEATNRVNTLRSVQLIAIGLALLNFLFIVFKFVRRLSASDKLAEAASKETQRILGAVQEGLFLIGADSRLGTQMSDSVHQIFKRRVRPGENFFELLAPLASNRALSEAREYVELMFARHVKQQLMQDLNPLTSIELQFTDALGTKQSKYLSFNFRRVDTEEGQAALLVTVQDVTDRIELESELDASQQQAAAELSSLIDTLRNDRTTLAGFLERTQSGLYEVNQMLEEGRRLTRRDDLVRLIERVARRMHSIKGDASALSLTMFATMAHDFEDELAEMRADANLTGESLLVLPPRLDEMLTKAELLLQVAAVPEAPASIKQEAAGPREQALVTMLQSLAANLTAELGKQVEHRFDFSPIDRLPPQVAEAVHDAAVQLVRNALVHGVELPTNRTTAGKLEQGVVEASLRLDARGRAQLTVRDDGIGIDPAELRHRLVKAGILTVAQAWEQTDQEVVQWLFRPGVSTREHVDHHAGRGVGLDLVKNLTDKLSGHLRLSTRPGRFAEFSIQFAV